MSENSILVLRSIGHCDDRIANRLSSREIDLWVLRWVDWVAYNYSNINNINVRLIVTLPADNSGWRFRLTFPAVDSDWLFHQAANGPAHYTYGPAGICVDSKACSCRISARKTIVTYYSYDARTASTASCANECIMLSMKKLNCRRTWDQGARVYNMWVFVTGNISILRIDHQWWRRSTATLKVDRVDWCITNRSHIYTRDRI